MQDSQAKASEKLSALMSKPTEAGGYIEWVHAQKKDSRRFDVSPLIKTERVGFEPTVGLTLRRFSRPVHSATLPPLLLAGISRNRRCSANLVGGRAM